MELADAVSSERKDSPKQNATSRPLGVVGKQRLKPKGTRRKRVEQSKSLKQANCLLPNDADKTEIRTHQKNLLR